MMLRRRRYEVVATGDYGLVVSRTTFRSRRKAAAFLFAQERRHRRRTYRIGLAS